MIVERRNTMPQKMIDHFSGKRLYNMKRVPERRAWGGGVRKIFTFLVVSSQPLVRFTSFQKHSKEEQKSFRLA